MGGSAGGTRAWMALVVVMALVLVALDGVRAYTEATRSAAERLTALGRVVESRIGQTFSSVDKLLAEVAAQLHPDQPASDPGLHAYLRTRAHINTHALTVTVVAPDGTIRHSSESHLVGRQVGDRSYLRHFRDHPEDDGMFVTEPVQGMLNRTILFTARAVRAPDGELMAVAVAALSPSMLSQLMEAAMPSEDSGAITLSNRHQIILARTPDRGEAAIGLSLAEAPLMKAHLASGLPATIQSGIGGIDGEWRLIALRDAPYGLRVGVSVATTDLLSPVAGSLTLDLLLVAVVVAISLTLARIQRARDRQRAEDQARILQARDAYLQILDNFPALIWRSDRGGGRDYVNRTWLNFTGRPLAEELGRGWLSEVHPADRAAASAPYPLPEADGSGAGERKYRLRRHGGEFRWLHEIATPLRDEEGGFAGHIGVCIDSTDALAAQERLRQSNEELEQFAYVASHDLREPLRMIASYLSLIERRLGASELQDIKEFLDFARDGATRMDRLVLDLLQLSRIGRLSSPPRPVDGADALATALRQLAVALEGSGAMVCVGDLPEVFASEDDLVRLFQNLVGNAVKYSRPGIAPRITVTATVEEGMWRFAVRDNGIGIAPEHYDRVFRIFQRLHGRDEYGGGSGMGLAICRKIVERQGGRLWIEPAAGGEGTAFLFTLPPPQADGTPADTPAP